MGIDYCDLRGGLHFIYCGVGMLELQLGVKTGINLQVKFGSNAGTKNFVLTFLNAWTDLYWPS